jgi:hypothetical protein
MPNITRTLTTLFTVFLFLALSSCGQNPGPVNYHGYSVDNMVKKSVALKVKSFNGAAQSSMDFKMYENDSLIADTYATGKRIDECMTMTSLEGDSINITGWLGISAAFGYQIVLFRDTCIVVHFAQSDAEVYKLREHDSLEFGVIVPCKHYTLTLSEKPNFKKGQVLEGVVELNSEDYYEVANGEEKRCKVQLTSYFRTAPIESLEDQVKHHNRKW